MVELSKMMSKEQEGVSGEYGWRFSTAGHVGNPQRAAGSCPVPASSARITLAHSEMCMRKLPLQIDGVFSYRQVVVRFVLLPSMSISLV